MTLFRVSPTIAGYQLLTNIVDDYSRLSLRAVIHRDSLFFSDRCFGFWIAFADLQLVPVMCLIDFMKWIANRLSEANRSCQ